MKEGPLVHQKLGMEKELFDDLMEEFGLGFGQGSPPASLPGRLLPAGLQETTSTPGLTPGRHAADPGQPRPSGIAGLSRKTPNR